MELLIILGEWFYLYINVLFVLKNEQCFVGNGNEQNEAGARQPAFGGYPDSVYLWYTYVVQILIQYKKEYGTYIVS